MVPFIETHLLKDVHPTDNILGCSDSKYNVKAISRYT